MTAATQSCAQFDFDAWSTLAKSDPVAFEEKRLALIEDFFTNLSDFDQQRLRGLQFRIDMERRRAKTPMAACLKLSAMMWDSLVGSHGLKDALDALVLQATHPATTTPAPAHPVRDARILPFRKSIP